MRQELREKAVLRRLAMLAARARGQVETDHAQVAEIGLQVAALAVELAAAEAGGERRRCTRVHADPRVAPPLRRMEVRRALARRAQAARHVVVMRLELLQADDVPRLDAREPARETLALGGANAVDVEGDDAHPRFKSGGECTRPHPVYSFALPYETTPLSNFRHDFLAFALARQVLRFGEFVTKAGRRSPYFFNAGLFDDGESLRTLGRFYAEALVSSGIAYDQLFGPAYKGIPLVATTAVALADRGQNV